MPADRDATTAPSMSVLDDAVDRFREAATAVSAATGAFVESDDPALRRYGRDVAAAVSAAERELTLSRNALEASGADSLDDVRRSVQDVAEAARGWFDEMAVRSRLARMDARDRAEDAAKRIERAAAEAKVALERVSGTVEGDLGEVRKAARGAIGRVRDALGEAASALREERDGADEE